MNRQQQITADSLTLMRRCREVLAVASIDQLLESLHFTHSAQPGEDQEGTVGDPRQSTSSAHQDGATGRSIYVGIVALIVLA